MDFRVLGLLEVVHDGRVIELRAAKHRMLVAALALHPNRVVPAERLIESLWGGAPPASAANTLQGYISHVRRVLAGEVIETRPPGYVLAVDADQVDAVRFERLVADGRRALQAGDPAQAGAGFARALALWRGPALADFAYEEFAQAEATRLEELRLVTYEHLLEAELAVGNDDAVVGQAGALVEQHPFRERLWAHLLVALYRTGRQSEALRAYGRLRRLLADELGIDPSPDLQRLEEAILRHELAPAPPSAPAVVPAAGAGGELPAAFAYTEQAPLLGRERELTALVQACEAGRPRHLVWVVGEGGIGKSRLVGELARKVAAAGATVLYGRFEADMAVPYQAVIDALQHHIRRGPADALAGLSTASAAELARLVPEIGERLGALPAPAKGEPQVQRYRLFQAVDALLSAQSQRAPVMLVLDDVHLADQPALLLLRHLVRSSEPGPLFIVAMYRDTDVDQAGPLADTVTDLHRDANVERLALTGLGPEAVSQFVRRSASPGLPPAAAPHVARFLLEETDGNPFYMRELLRHLTETGAFAGGTDGLRRRVPVPPTVKEVIGWRVARLPKGAQRILEVAAVAGREFDVEVVAAVAHLTEDDLCAGLEAAVGARLVGEVVDGPGRYSFGHALTREALYENLSALRRSLLHRDVGRFLEQLPGDAGRRLGEIARHYFAAGGAQLPAAVEYARRAGEAAVAQLAYEDAAFHLACAADAARRGAAEEPVLCSLLIALGDARRSAGDEQGARQAFDEAATLARALGDTDRLADAAIGLAGVGFQGGSADRHVIGLLEEVLQRLGPAPTSGRVRALAAYARSLTWSRQVREMQRISGEAVATGRAVGDPIALADALSADFVAYFGVAPERCAASARELMEAARQSGDLSAQAESHVQGLISQLELGDREGVDKELDALQRFATESRQPLYRWYATSWDATMAVAEGRFADGQRLAEEAVNVGWTLRGVDATTAFVAHISPIRWAEGRIGEILTGLDAYIAQYPGQPGWRASRVWMLAAAGQHECAWRDLDQLVSEGLEVVESSVFPLATLAFLAHTSAMVGFDRCAADLYERLQPYAAYQVVIQMWQAGGVASGAVPYFLGGVAALAGEWEKAFLHYEEALEFHERMRMRPWLGWTYLRYGLAVRARRDPRDAGRVGDLLDRAVAVAGQVGMPHLLREAEAARRDVAGR